MDVCFLIAFFTYNLKIMSKNVRFVSRLARIYDGIYFIKFLEGQDDHDP